MKVLITTDWYKPVINGVVTSVVNLAAGLTELGHEVRILTLSGDRASHTEDNVTYIGSVSVGMIYPNARLKTAPSSRYVRELIDWHPDIVHSQCEFSTFFLARKISEACGCPLVHTYHTVYEDFTHYFSPSVRFGKYMAAAFSRHILAKTQAVIVPTGKIQTMLAGYAIQTPISVIPSGLNLEQYASAISTQERNTARHALGFTEKDRVLVYLGRLAKEKNISELFEFFAQQNEPQLRLLLVGDGPHRVKLEEEAAALGISERVVFTGMVPPSEVARYYRLGDIFVSASQSETQGLTYVEAMAAGLPLLCRDDLCLQDVIKSGINGFTYHNATEFHQILSQLLSDTALCRALSQAAKETAFGCYSAKSFAQHAANVYQTLLDQDAAAADHSAEEPLSA